MKNVKFWINVIAGFVSGIGVLALDKLFLNNIKWEEIDFIDLGEILATTVTLKLYHIITFFILFFMLLSIKKWWLKPKSNYTSKQLRFIKKNKVLTDDGNDLTFRLHIEFNGRNEPVAISYNIYCHKHSPPLEYFRFRCPDVNCPNHHIFVDYEMHRRQMTSKLIHDWDEF